MDEDTEDDVVVTQSGRLTGCRGRVLVAVILLAILLTLLVAILVRGMLTGSPPQPVRRAALDTPPTAGVGTPMIGRDLARRA